MKNEINKIIFHIDTNSAFLSWEATHRLKMGDKLDLRTIPSIVGGDRQKRRGVVLAKSVPATKYNIKTGEPIATALKKCPDLKIVPPNFDVYIEYSKKMFNILKQYSSKVERYSIDEGFIDYGHIKYSFKNYIEAANSIKESIKNNLGFTVNIGIGSNKLLAKMASDFEKPDKIHTLFDFEVKKKMWSMPIEKLFMVGKATSSKLRELNINTIGELALYDLEILQYKFKRYGILIWNYANGIDESIVGEKIEAKMKGIGNSTTIPYDVKEKDKAYEILYYLVNKVTSRLRNSKNSCASISVTIKNSSFETYSHQRKLDQYVNSKEEILKITKELFDEVWRKDPIRLLGVRVSSLSPQDSFQISFFDNEQS
ncbi:Y-family DNA polymerase [Clostridium brassicae]|uniref:DNA polymerase IV n=1 Tax=Clostridium brassicae TaxID=2999072 RepID=A0ABT4D5Y6_9CLOT|nr:DNA polymerase IV [Clostridium brassicae]MCY6957704.1 DNA polymerase IV [Clostridium brassicae]